MEKEEISVNGKKFIVRELLATELDEITDMTDKKASLKKQVMLGANITEEEYNKLTVKERFSIIETMNKLNLTDDFQKRLEDKKLSA